MLRKFFTALTVQYSKMILNSQLTLIHSESNYNNFLTSVKKKTAKVMKKMQADGAALLSRYAIYPQKKAFK